MTYKFSRLLFVLLAGHGALQAAEPYLIRGTILDQQQQPLGRAFNFSTDHGGIGAVELDGNFELQMPDGVVAGLPIKVVIPGYRIIIPVDGVMNTPARGIPANLIVASVTTPKNDPATTVKPISPVDTVVFEFVDKAEKGDKAGRLIALRNLRSMRGLAKPGADRIANILHDSDIEIATTAADVLESTGGDSDIVILHLKFAIQDTNRPAIQIAAMRTAASLGPRGRTLLDVIEPLATDPKLSQGAQLWPVAIQMTVALASELKPSMAKTALEMNQRAPVTGADSDKFCDMVLHFDETVSFAPIMIPFSDTSSCFAALKSQGAANQPAWTDAIRRAPFLTAVNLGEKWMATNPDAKLEAAREVCQRVDAELTLSEALSIGSNLRKLIASDRNCARIVTTKLLTFAVAEKSPNERRRVIDLMKEIGETLVPELREASNSADARRQLEAVRTLGKFSDFDISEEVRTLGGNLNSDKPDVVMDVIRLLKDLGPRGEPARPQLVEWLQAHFKIDDDQGEAAEAIVSMGPVPEEALRTVSLLVIETKHIPGVEPLTLPFGGIMSRGPEPKDVSVYRGKVENLEASIRAAGHHGEIRDETLRLLLQLANCRYSNVDENGRRLIRAAQSAITELDEGSIPGVIRLLFDEPRPERDLICFDDAANGAKTLFARVASRAGAAVPLILPFVTEPPKPDRYDNKQRDYARNLLAIDLLTKIGKSASPAIDVLIATLLNKELRLAAEKALLAIGDPAKNALKAVSNGPNKKLRGPARSALAKFTS
jgi:hypothetical protein